MPNPPGNRINNLLKAAFSTYSDRQTERIPRFAANCLINNSSEIIQDNDFHNFDVEFPVYADFRNFLNSKYIIYSILKTRVRAKSAKSF